MVTRSSHLGPRPPVPASWLLPLAAAWTIALGGGCPSLTANTYADAAGRWQLGDRPGALASARGVYRRFLQDNGVDSVRVDALTRQARTILDEAPVWDAPPGGGRPGDAQRAHRLQGDPDALTKRLRADLLSGRVTPTLRAVATVEALGLQGEARGLLAVIFRRPIFTGGEDLLPDASVAERSLVAKRAALGALEALASPRTTRPQPAF